MKRKKISSRLRDADRFLRDASPALRLIHDGWRQETSEATLRKKAALTKLCKRTTDGQHAWNRDWKKLGLLDHAYLNNEVTCLICGCQREPLEKRLKRSDRLRGSLRRAGR